MTPKDEGSGVRRYRLSYKHGVIADDGSYIGQPADASEPMVTYADYQALSAEREAACRDANEKAFRCDALSARVAQLEEALWQIVSYVAVNEMELAPPTPVAPLKMKDIARAALRGGTEEDSDVHRGAK